MCKMSSSRSSSMKLAFLPSTLLLVALVLLSSPSSSDAFLTTLFRDIGETIFDGLVGLKRAVGLNDLADRLEREKERRNRRRNKGKKSGKGKRSVPDAVVDEYARRVAEALEAAAIADYGDCAKKLICDVSRKQLSSPSTVTPTEASLLKLFPAVQVADDVRLSSGSTAQLDIAVVVGRGSIGHNDTVVSPTSACDGVYARCPVDAASLLQMVSDGGMSAEEAIALTNNVVDKK